MKNKIDLVLFFALICSSALVFNSCKRNNDPPCTNGANNYYNITADEKSKIPYTGTDTLIYISNSNDTAKLLGQGKQDYFLNQPHYGGNPECNPGSENYQTYYYSFMGKQSLLNEIDVEYHSTGGGVYDMNINITINNIKIINENLFAYFNSNYTDTIHINNKLYYGRNIKGDGIDSLTVFFYNYNFGILKIKFSNNQIWLKQ